jgi:hypothetical protein
MRLGVFTIVSVQIVSFGLWQRSDISKKHCISVFMVEMCRLRKLLGHMRRLQEEWTFRPRGGDMGCSSVLDNRDIGSSQGIPCPTHGGSVSLWTYKNIRCHNSEDLNLITSTYFPPVLLEESTATDIWSEVLKISALYHFCTILCRLLNMCDGRATTSSRYLFLLSIVGSK